jgi:hypothetical protein
MRVFLIATHDNAQQHWLLAKAMRDYLGWEAMSMVKKSSYLGYETDWTVENNTEEAKEYIKTADLLIFQDMLLDIEGLGLQQKANKKNTIINGTGSMMRIHLPVILADQRDGWAVVPCLADETLSTVLCAPPFENWIVPIEKIREITRGMKKNNGISICHAPTKTDVKGTMIIEEILQHYIESGEIEYERISGISWEEAIKRKAKHNIILDSFGNLTSSYGAGNALEGLVLGQTVVSKISPWCYALHPDLPMTTTFGKDQKEVIDNTIHRRRNGITTCDWGRMWVERHFSAENQITHWEHYINWVMTR